VEPNNSMTRKQTSNGAQTKPHLLDRILGTDAPHKANPSAWYLGDINANAQGKGIRFPSDRYGSNSIGSPSYYAPSTSYGSNLDYEREAGALEQNAIVMACINSIMSAFPEAPMQVMKETSDGPVEVKRHKMTQLVRKPNPYYSGRLLWQSTVFSYNLNGNAYWLKVRNASGQVVELWYEPHFNIRCRWPENGSEFISHYEVYRHPHWLRVEREDVIHFRFGIDPHNPRYGLSKLASALREVFTDNQGARYTAAMLRNFGIPGVVLSPKGDGYIDDTEAVKMLFMQKFSGDRVGEPMVMERALDVAMLSFSPDKMDLKSLRRIPEERIPALLSWPAVVAGLGAGLDRSTYNNMDEARQQAYEQNIIPTQQVLADDLDTQLMPDMGDPNTEAVAFDLKKVRVLQDDENKKAQRWVLLYSGGIAKLSEARAANDLKVSDGEDTYKVSVAVQAATINAGDEVDALDPKAPKEEALNDN
jgi:HK97 family phage portal protein